MKTAHAFARTKTVDFSHAEEFEPVPFSLQFL